MIRTFFLIVITLCVSSLAQTRYYGGIDLGSKGTKADLFSMGRDMDLGNDRLYAKIINTKLVSSMEDGKFTDAGIQDATDAVKRLVEEMRATSQAKRLGQVEYFVVGSSGVAKAKNRDTLIASIKAATGINMDFIDAKKEGFFGLRSTVPASKLTVSLFLDIGSGNTKLGCLVGGTDISNFRSAEIQYGSVSGRKKAAERVPDDIKAGVNQVMSQEVKPAYEKESMDTPCLRNRERIYWTGGAAWATATFMHPEKALSDYVMVRKRDLDTFLVELGNGSWLRKHTEYNFPADMPLKQQKEIRVKAESDRKAVMDTFVQEDLLSGVSIMKTVLDCSNPSATLVFSRGGGSSNILLGYALEKYHSNGIEAASHKEVLERK